MSVGNETEAAIKAGYKNNPELIGQSLVCREDICNEIQRLYDIRRESIKNAVSIGYERLAFGNISDAVRLLYMENPTAEQLEKMNLYNVSEIKRPKDGAMEIKFFDRIKAVEKLQEMYTDKNKINSDSYTFYKALENSAKTVFRNNEEEINED